VRLATICILTYGDHYDYLTRCLSSIIREVPAASIELRIGFNTAPGCFDLIHKSFFAPIIQTEERIDDNLTRHSFEHLGMTIRLYNSTVNLYKTPMQRVMFHEPRMETQYVIWFDDDSYIEPGYWKSLLPDLDGENDYIGQQWRVDYKPTQIDMVKSLPFYRGRPFLKGRDMPYATAFMTGGYNVIKCERLYEIDWPPTDLVYYGRTLRHSFEDAVMGEAANQMGWKRKINQQKVKVNVDMRGIHPAPSRYIEKQFGVL
jgi:hypothetical protein